MTRFFRRLAALLVAALITGALTSLVQTQVNLAEHVALGAQVSGALRGAVTLEDLARFGPVAMGVAIVALLLAFLVAHGVARYVLPGWRTMVFAVAGLCGMTTAFGLLATVIPSPPLAATRTGLGLLLVSLSGLIGGLVYARITRMQALASSHPGAGRSQAAASSHPGIKPMRVAASTAPTATRRYLAIAAVCAVVPVVSFFMMAQPKDPVPQPVDPASFQVQTVATGLDAPWSVAFLPDGRRLVTEMGGRLRVVQPDGTLTDIALDGMPPIFRTGTVIGLMEVAVDPAFAETNWLFFTMGYGDAGAVGTRVVRATLDGDRIKDVRVLFSSTLKSRDGNNGGRIAFLRDGTLVVTIGDGNLHFEAAQSTADYLGTVIRIDRDGRAPADNPFRQTPGALPEIYSIGHRNAQGIALDPTTGELLSSEHGARGGDEINRIVAGGNYGWPLVTGGIDYWFARVSPFKRLEGYVDPSLEWTPSIAPSGLAIYDGAMFPAWRGDLFVPALKERAVRRVKREGGRIVGQELLLANMDARMRDVKVAPDGSIYVLTDGKDAKLLRLVPPAASSGRTPSPATTRY